MKNKEKELAEELDRAAGTDEPTAPPPPEEFQKIIQEMERRGIEPNIRKELSP